MGRNHKHRIAGLQETAANLNGYRKVFGLPIQQLESLSAVQGNAEELYAVWQLLMRLQEKLVDWTTGTMLERGTNKVGDPSHSM